MLFSVSRSKVLGACFAISASMLVACGNNPIAPAPIIDPAQATYATSLGIDLTQFTKTSSGLYYRDEPAGLGTAADSGDTVSVDYVGRFTNGSRFDCSRCSADQTFSFVLGVGKVIKGWDEGVKGMRIGGKRRLIVPPSLGYGELGSGSIPGNTILVFDITLYGVGKAT